jgi:hypothetical protein
MIQTKLFKGEHEVLTVLPAWLNENNNAFMREPQIKFAIGHLGEPQVFVVYEILQIIKDLDDLMTKEVDTEPTHDRERMHDRELIHE